MLPSRPRLERWNPDSLKFTGQAVKESGKAVDDAVTTVSTNIKTMPDTKAWSGPAHTAATTMFERASKQTHDFSAYTTAVGDALAAGADSIGESRTALLNKADEVDASGQLSVSDQWVVLISGARLTAEEAAALERRAQAEQVVVNGLLMAVGAADERAAADLTAAAKPYDFEAPNPADAGSLLAPGSQQPGDEIPNPSNPASLVAQAMLRDADMAQTVRDTEVETRYDPATGEETATTTTLHMQDGGKHVRTVNARSQFSDRGPVTTETHYDKDGNVISESSSVTFNDLGDHSLANAQVTAVKMADGTVVSLIERQNGSRSGTILTPYGHQADVPLELFDGPLLTAADAAFAGLEAQAGRGIPMLTEEAVERIRVGAKYGGPALGVASALWDVAVADSGFERCVAAAEGATSLASGTIAGLATSGTGPWVAIPVALVAWGGGEAVGNWIGNTFCPR